MVSIYRIILTISIICVYSIADAQFRVSIAIDNAIGIGNNQDYYLGLAHRQFERGWNIPSFTITKSIRSTSDLIIQSVINRSNDTHKNEVICISYKSQFLLNKRKLCDYSLGLFINTSEDELVDPTPFNHFRNRLLPGLAASVLKDFNLTPRLFVRLQLLTLSKINYINKQLNGDMAALFNIGIGMSFGKTDRAFPKQDEINDL